MTDLRDLRVPGLGLAPAKTLDDLYPRHYDPLVAEFLRSRRKSSGLTALFARLRTAAHRGRPMHEGVHRGARAGERPGMTFGHAAR